MVDNLLEAYRGARQKIYDRKVAGVCQFEDPDEEMLDALAIKARQEALDDPRVRSLMDAEYGPNKA